MGAERWKVEYLRPSDTAPRSALDRLEAAEEFLRIGIAEIGEGRRSLDYTRIREGSEKVFHSLVEATNARLLKYGMSPPGQHRETLDVLRGIDPELKQVYEDTFARLHVLVYYQGVIDISEVEQTVKRVQRAVARIRRFIKGR